MASLLILVLNRNLVPTIDPIMQTLVRLCIDLINPICNVSMQILFDWMCDDYDNDAVDNNDINESGGGKEAVIFDGSNGIMDLMAIFLSGPGGGYNGTRTGNSNENINIPSTEDVER